MGRNAFLDPLTNVLKSHGFTETNEPGDVKMPVSEDFALAPAKWQWNGTAWVAFVAPPPPLSPLAVALDAYLNAPLPTPAQLKAILQAWRQQVS